MYVLVLRLQTCKSLKSDKLASFDGGERKGGGKQERREGDGKRGVDAGCDCFAGFGPPSSWERVHR